MTKKKSGSSNRLSKYGRELLILKIIKKIHTEGITRVDIVEWIKKDYNYAIGTINNLISEANKKAAELLSEEDKAVVKNQIFTFHYNIMFSEDEPTPIKQKSADKLYDIIEPRRSEIHIGDKNLIFSDIQKVNNDILDEVEKKIRMKRDENDLIVDENGET